MFIFLTSPIRSLFPESMKTSIEENMEKTVGSQFNGVIEKGHTFDKVPATSTRRGENEIILVRL